MARVKVRGEGKEDGRPGMDEGKEVRRQGGR